MEARSVSPSPVRTGANSRARLLDHGLDADRVIGEFGPGAPIDLTRFYDLLAVIASSEKAGQSPAYALARLALHSRLGRDVEELLFLAYNQQSAEEAGHGDKVFANAYFAMGSVAPDAGESLFGDGDDTAGALVPTDDPEENARVLRTTAAVIGGIETVALQRVFPLVTALCEAWDHPVGHDLAAQIRDVVRPEESRHVLIWRYVFHRLVAPRGGAAVEAYLAGTNDGRTQLGTPRLDRPSLFRMLGAEAPTARQLLGKDRTLYG